MMVLFQTGAQAYSYAYFGQGTGPIQLDNVGCSGAESTLLQCSHLTIINNCVHAEDAGVRCSQPGICISVFSILNMRVIDLI